MRLALLACVLVSAGLLSGPADARSRDKDKDKDKQAQSQQERQQDDAQRGNEKPRDQSREVPDRSADAARRAKLRNGGGRVLSVERERAGHRVKVLKDGEVRVLHVEDE